MLPGGQALVQAAFGGIDQGRDPLVGDEVAPLRRRDESRLAFRDLAGDRRFGPGPRLIPRARHRLGGCASESGLRGGQLASEFALGPFRELRPDPIKTSLGALPGRILTLGRGRVLLGAVTGEELVDASVEPAEGPLDLGAALAPPPLELGGKRMLDVRQPARRDRLGGIAGLAHRGRMELIETLDSSRDLGSRRRHELAARAGLLGVEVTPELRRGPLECPRELLAGALAVLLGLLVEAPVPEAFTLVEGRIEPGAQHRLGGLQPGLDRGEMLAGVAAGRTLRVTERAGPLLGLFERHRVRLRLQLEPPLRRLYAGIGPGRDALLDRGDDVLDARRRRRGDRLRAGSGLDVRSRPAR